MPAKFPHKPPRSARQNALEAVRTLLAYIGEDPLRPGLRETPERVLRAWESTWGHGYQIEPRSLIKLFAISAEDGDTCAFNQMIVVRDIVFYSHCEHHMTPFFGVGHIAYIPHEAGRIGLSKLARVVDFFARRLQVQERLTEQIADFLEGHLSADVGVVLEASHMCMMSRGVQQPNARTITTALRGDFMDDPTTRGEFLAAIRK